MQDVKMDMQSVPYKRLYY